MSYDWVLMIVLLFAFIFMFEIMYSIMGVRLTVGQSFKYYYDVNISTDNENAFLEMLFVDNNTFSYDTLLINGELVSKENNILKANLKIQEGDVIITDIKASKDNDVRANSFIDSPMDYPIYNFNELLEDGKSYLREFLKDEFLSLTESEQNEKIKNKDNFSTEKIDKAFRTRMKGDNRFRKEEQIAEGLKYERERIYDLAKEVDDFEYLLQVGDDYGVFYRYTRFTQIHTLTQKEYYKGMLEQEKEQGRENAIYGLKVENLKNGKHDPSEFFKLLAQDEVTAKDVIVMVFDFFEYQKEHQLETVAFINSIVRSCSDIYSNR